MSHRRVSSAVAIDAPELSRFLDAVVAGGADVSPRLILADWLEEHNRPREAELLRLHVSLLATCCVPENHPERVPQQTRLVELLTAGVRPCLPQRTIALAEAVDMRFAWVSPGTFRMGSPLSEAERSDDETQHRVTLTRGFYVGIHAVTQAQWQAVMDNDPSRFKGADHPVELVSWDNCQEFCTKLGEKVGQRFRLPTESEWEYACRAGTTTPFFFGETVSPEQANYEGNYIYGTGQKGVYREQTTPVGSFPANAWGVFDLHGNVWEWCWDFYDPHPKNDIKDPQLDNNGEARVLRGGSWLTHPRRCRSAIRLRDAPDCRYGDVGCRVVLCLD